MRSVNKVILIGNAIRDAELRHTQTSQPVSAIRLVTNRRDKGEEETQFHSIICWDRLAETTAAYVKKGDPLYVEGRLHYSAYQDEEGVTRGKCEIVAIQAYDAASGSYQLHWDLTDESGNTMTPKGIVVGNAGRVYITDGAIYVYECRS